jgi:hypothetical protein
MAKVTGVFSAEGALGNLVIVKRRDQDVPYVRTKGGPSKKQIAQLPAFAATRRNNAEWSGCSKAGTAIRLATYALKSMADYNVSAGMNALMKIVQKQDQESPHGQRNILLSKNKDLLTGFSFNRKKLLDMVLQCPIEIITNRETATITIKVPRIIPDVNLKQYGTNPLLRLVVSLGTVSDMCYNITHNRYEPEDMLSHGKSTFTASRWFPVKQSIEAQEIEVSLTTENELQNSDSFIVGFGLEFGYPLTDSVIEPKKYSGCAKIIAVF